MHEHSRGSFNTNLYVWPCVDGVPDVMPVSGPHPCRYVLQTQIVPQLWPFAFRLAWVTTEVEIQAAEVSLFDWEALTSWGVADQLTIDSHPDTFFVVLMREDVTPEGELPYVRYWVAERWW